MVITVDGPAGTGKSTVARALAEDLGIPHLDTGAFYRAVTLAVVRARVDPTDAAAVLTVAAASRLDYADGAMFLNGEEVTEAGRAPDVVAQVSAVSAFPDVRRLVVEEQRAWVRRHGGRAVVEGRDIGTVVFPDAPVKVYLVADVTERARRRSGDPEAAGQNVADIERDLRARDLADSTRAASPLRPADDAVTIDTTHLSVRDVVAVVRALVAEGGG